MPNLKDMRVRIAATKATQKITKAMQMVAASKLRRAQAAAEAARPYAERMEKVLGNIAASVAGSSIRRRGCSRHRQRPRASPARLHRRARAVRPVQFGDRAARPRARQCADRRRQGGQVLLRRTQGLRAARRLYEQADHRASSSCARCAPSVRQCRGIAERILRALCRRRASTSARCSSRASSR